MSARILKFFILILLIFNITHAQPAGIDPTFLRQVAEMTSTQVQSVPATQVHSYIAPLENLGRIGELTGPQLAPNMALLSAEGIRQLQNEQLIFQGLSGEPLINEVDDWDDLDDNERDEALSDITGRRITTRNINNGRVEGNGLSFDDIGLLKIDGTSITNAIGVVYDGTKLKFKHADSVVTDKSASINIDNFEGFADSFKVEKADSLLSGCLRFDNIEKSEFSVFDSKVEVNVENGNNITMTDCSYTQSEFESRGNGSVAISKDQKPEYEIKEGILKCRYGLNTDKLEAENTASVDIDNCFSCMTIAPAGTYFYSDADIRKDFNINVPKESSTYRLCLKKNQLQQFRDYNGLVDFADKRIELNGIVNYLKYPMKNNKVSSLLSSFVYRGLKDVNALLNYDNDLLFLEDVNIKNTVNNMNQITASKPSNFYSIEETEIEGKVHRIVDLSIMKKEDLTQSIVSNYESDSLDASVVIRGNILTQQAGESKVTIMPPGHQKIGSFLR